jgi:hypothetical protein
MTDYKAIEFQPLYPGRNRHQRRANAAAKRKWETEMRPRVARWLTRWAHAVQSFVFHCEYGLTSWALDETEAALGRVSTSDYDVPIQIPDAPTGDMQYVERVE